MASAGPCSGTSWWPAIAGPRPRPPLIEELLHTPAVGVEQVYLMTTKSAGFYRQLGFKDANPQQLMVLRR